MFTKSAASPTPIDPQAIAWPTLVPEDPIVAGPLAVYPLFSPPPTPQSPNPPAEPGYLLLEQALKAGLVQVTEVNEAGNVPTIALINHAALPILALQGQELIGAKQNRTLNVTILAPSGRTEIPVTCVERGRWGYQTARFGAGGVEHFALRSKKAEMVAAAAKRHRGKEQRYYVDQMAVWDEVDLESDRHAVCSATSALSDVYEAPSVAAGLRDFDAINELPEGAVGVAVAIGGELVAAEFLETAEAFAALWPSLRKGYALSALGREQKDVPSRMEAQAFVSLPGGGEVETGEAVGLGVDVRWEGGGFLASGLLHEGRMVHGALFAQQAK